MIETSYGQITEKLCDNYFGCLINKIYKILPLKEEQFPTVNQYIESLLFEMTGNKKIIASIREDGQYLAVIGTLENLRQCDSIKICKKEIFKCIRLIDSLNKRYFGGD